VRLCLVNAAATLETVRRLWTMSTFATCFCADFSPVATGPTRLNTKWSALGSWALHRPNRNFDNNRPHNHAACLHLYAATILERHMSTGVTCCRLTGPCWPNHASLCFNVLVPCRRLTPPGVSPRTSVTVYTGLRYQSAFSFATDTGNVAWVFAAFLRLFLLTFTAFVLRWAKQPHVNAC